MALFNRLVTAGLLLSLSFTLSQGFTLALTSPVSTMQTALRMSASTTAAAATVPSWSDLKQTTQSTVTGSALTADAALRKEGRGTPHRENTLRLFDDSSTKTPQMTLFRDHAAWCPYVRT